ncbi:hypothetical protein OSB04_010897 [Centaurea solstitialis]|uniref:F-box domain-containing protein n=1 Tax=Centaurea solstitialis TaxID=347529 RepID=A0AA38TT65_9ASTR|nr:hypothetical protein OSB04_010897 [Centaurea solstitialis]
MDSKLPHEVIIEIFSRTTLKTFYSIVSTNKEFNKLKYNSYFLHLYKPRNNIVSGFLVQRFGSDLTYVNEFGPSQESADLDFDFLSSDVHILASSDNGIIVFESPNCRYYVGKPTTKQLIKLPINPKIENRTEQVAIMFMGLKPFRYKILRISSLPNTSFWRPWNGKVRKKAKKRGNWKNSIQLSSRRSNYHHARQKKSGRKQSGQRSLQQHMCLHEYHILQDCEKEKKEAQYRKFIEIIKQVHIDVPLVDLIAGVPNYVRFLKELVANKARMGAEEIAFLNAECSAILFDTPKKGDPGSFTIPCYFGKNVSCRALADLGASINLMPLSFYQRLGLKDLKSTRMTIQLADRSIKYPVGVAEDVTVRVGKFVFPADFVILDINDEVKVPLILGRPFLNTASAVIHVVKKELSLGIGKDRITFSIDGTLDCDESINNLGNVDDFTESFEIELNDHLFEPGELEESLSIEKRKEPWGEKKKNSRS